MIIMKINSERERRILNTSILEVQHLIKTIDNRNHYT